MTRVLIADDSLTVRKAVADRLRNAGMDVVGEAQTGAEAVAQTHHLRPDVILMDVVMPKVDGLAATRQIMTEIPTPIVILSAYSNRQEVFKTYDALAAGALEVKAKPVAGSPDEQHQWDEILCIVRAATQVSLISARHKPKYVALPKHRTPETEKPESCRVRRQLVVIGASTGGPAAVRALFNSIPADFPLPILLAIHCSNNLPVSIGTWLAGQCPLKVADAKHGQTIPDQPGTVVVAPPGRNFTVKSGRAVLGEPDDIYGNIPCIDALFSSVAKEYGSAAIGVLLTGMGGDGAMGLKGIHDAGGFTIVQSKESCVVFGMPSVAIQLGAAQHVLPLEQMPSMLVHQATLAHACSSSAGGCE